MVEPVFVRLNKFCRRLKLTFWGAILLVVLCACGCSFFCGNSCEAREQHLELWTIALKPKFTAYMEDLLLQFEGGHPGVKVDWIDLPQQNIMQKLMASIAGGVPPDLVNLTTSNALFLAQSGSLVDVSQYITTEQAGEYYPNLWRAAAWQGQVYAVPWYVSTRVLIYNKELLNKAGWPVDKPPRNREEAAALAAQVKRNVPGSWGFYPVVRLLDDWGMENMPVYDNSSKKFLFTQSNYVEKLEWYVRLYQQGLLPPEFLMDGYRGALERYKQGSLALLEAGPQVLLQIKADAPHVYAQTWAAPLSWSPEGRVPAALMNLAVPRSSRHRALACELALFITSWSNQLAFAKEVPLLPSTWRSTRDPFFTQRHGDPLQCEALNISLRQLPKANDYSLSLPGARQLERTLNLAVEAAVYGQKSSAEALTDAVPNP